MDGIMMDLATNCNNSVSGKDGRRSSNTLRSSVNMASERKESNYMNGISYDIAKSKSRAHNEGVGSSATNALKMKNTMH